MPRVERIRHQLLQKNDWAAVGATRPARISFTPADELARFGKRRKLTHADYDRILADSGCVARPVSKDTRQQAPSGPGTIGHLNIRIRGVQVNPECQKQCESSQRMLLDEFVDASGGSEGYKMKETSSSLLLSDDELASTGMLYQQSFLSPGSAHPSFLSENSPGLLHSGPQIPETPIIPRRSSAISSENDHRALPRENSPELHHPVPQLPKRFTIDDQLSAELESSVAPSPFSVKNTDPDYEITEKQSTSGWLPKPRQQIRRFVEKPPGGTPSTASLSDIVCSDHLMQQNVAPVRLFGQTVTASSFQYDTNSTLQPHRFIPDSHRSEYTSAPIGIVQEDTGFISRFHPIAGSIYANKLRSGRPSTNHYPEVSGFDRNLISYI